MVQIMLVMTVSFALELHPTDGDCSLRRHPSRPSAHGVMKTDTDQQSSSSLQPMQREDDSLFLPDAVAIGALGLS